MNLKHNYRIASFKVCLISEKFSSSFVKGKIKIIRGNLNRNPDKKPEILRSLCSSIRFPSLIKQNGLLKFGQKKKKKKPPGYLFSMNPYLARTNPDALRDSLRVINLPTRALLPLFATRFPFS